MNDKLLMMNTKNTPTKLIIISCLMMFLFSFQAQAYEPNEEQIAPDFEIMQLDGTKFKLSEYKGKQSVYVVFWNTWCHFCMKKIPKLKAVQQNLPKDIKIIAVNTSRDDSIAESLDFQKRFDINYSLAFDAGKKITDLYNVHGVPTEFIIDINGIIKHRDGVPDQLEDYIGQWNQVGNANAASQLITNSINEIAALVKKLYNYI